MLNFADSGLYFVQDQNNFINPLLQVAGQKSTDPTGSGSLSLLYMLNDKKDKIQRAMDTKV